MTDPTIHLFDIKVPWYGYWFGGSLVEGPRRCWYWRTVLTVWHRDPPSLEPDACDAAYRRLTSDEAAAALRMKEVGAGLFYAPCGLRVPVAQQETLLLDQWRRARRYYRPWRAWLWCLRHLPHFHVRWCLPVRFGRGTKGGVR